MLKPLLPLLLATAAVAQTPENLVTEGLPPITPELRARAARYLEFRSASFLSWHPTRREMLVTTRFGDTPQLHLVAHPGAARRQITFQPEPVSAAAFQPGPGRCVVFAQDSGGGEFYQLHRLDLEDGKITLLTDGKSRNTGAKWARSGHKIAWTSTRRNGTDNDVWVMNPTEPSSARLAAEVSGGGWSVLDWSHDEKQLLVGEYISVTHSRLHLLDLRTGKLECLTPDKPGPAVWEGGEFTAGDAAIYTTTDLGSPFQRLARLDLRTRRHIVLTPHIAWDIEAFALSPDGRQIAHIANEDGAGVLRLRNTTTGAESRPKLPTGVLSGLEWRRDSRTLAFSINSARSPSDAHSLDTTTGALTRWTESETGGLDTRRFPEPELVRVKSFDGVTVSGFLYRPDPAKFPGPRPLILSIHGGPESQSRPTFLARNNYYLAELGVALFYPNVRGSTGYGKEFVALDNGKLREDSVRDIGAFLEHLRSDRALDASRVAVMGGSYGGYMVLASLIHHGAHLRCGVDVVGISNFLTFLKNTQGYRRDLRRVEYGDERDPSMADFLDRISPTRRAAEIKKPLFVVQGANDPRVPLTESEQMVDAVRKHGGTVWYLMAKDEGHGFGKKRNADFQFHAMLLFWEQHLLR